MLQLVHHPSFISRLEWPKHCRQAHACCTAEQASEWQPLERVAGNQAVENFEHQSASGLIFASFGTLCLASNYEALQAKSHLSRKSSPIRRRTELTKIHFISTNHSICKQRNRPLFSEVNGPSLITRKSQSIKRLRILVRQLPNLQIRLDS
jgi:hypothetical protein